MVRFILNSCHETNAWRVQRQTKNHREWLGPCWTTQIISWRFKQRENFLSGKISFQRYKTYKTWHLCSWNVSFKCQTSLKGANFEHHLENCSTVSLEKVILVGSTPHQGCNRHHQKYCWWLKSCSTWDVWNPINNGINYLPTGAGFQPSTVLHVLLGIPKTPNWTFICHWHPGWGVDPSYTWMFRDGS